MSGQIKSIGILAGEGALPHDLVNACLFKKITPNLVKFRSCEYRPFPNISILDARLEQVGRIFDFFKSRNVTHVVMIGNLGRPSIIDLRPDFKGFKTLLRIGKNFAMGDDNLLKSLRAEIENAGYIVCGVDMFVDDLTLPVGIHTQTKLVIATNKGMMESLKHGQADKGQSVLMHEDGSFSYEERSGTTALIQNCGRKRSVLYKTMKPQQDPDLDRPTIGLDTFKALKKKECAGVVVQANTVFVLDQDACIAYADENKMFIEAKDG
jgi:DUF1009 family protein